MARLLAYRSVVTLGQARPSGDGDSQRGVEPAGPRIFDTSKMRPKPFRLQPAAQTFSAVSAAVSAAAVSAAFFK